MKRGIAYFGDDTCDYCHVGTEEIYPDCRRVQNLNFFQGACSNCARAGGLMRYSKTDTLVRKEKLRLKLEEFDKESNQPKISNPNPDLAISAQNSEQVSNNKRVASIDSSLPSIKKPKSIQNNSNAEEVPGQEIEEKSESSIEIRFIPIARVHTDKDF